MVEKYPYSFSAQIAVSEQLFQMSYFCKFQVYTSLQSNIWLTLHAQLAFMDQPIWCGKSHCRSNNNNKKK